MITVELDRAGFNQFGDSRKIILIASSFQDRQRDRSIHRPGVQKAITHSLREQSCDRAFS
jgi:hypothetical protein